MGENAPAFSFYAKDFMLGTVTMSLAERGAYITLLAYQWDAGSVPSEPSVLARIFGCSVGQAARIWTAVSGKFQQGPDGLWRNMRLEGERIKQADRRAALAANGRKGAEHRWSDGKPMAPPLAGPMAPPMANTSQSDGLSFPDPDPSSFPEDLTEKKNAPAERAAAFMRWYEDTHERLFRVAYMGTQQDWQKSLELCGKFSDDDLRDGALVWFGMDDPFAVQGTRSIPKFASRITGCLQQAKARGIA